MYAKPTYAIDRDDATSSFVAWIKRNKNNYVHFDHGAFFTKYGDNIFVNAFSKVFWNKSKKLRIGQMKNSISVTKYNKKMIANT